MRQYVLPVGLVVLGALSGACSSSSGPDLPDLPEPGAPKADAGLIVIDVPPPDDEHDSGKARHDAAAKDQGHDAAVEAAASCTLTSQSAFGTSTITFVGGTDQADCPTSDNGNIASGGCTISQTQGCSGDISCSFTAMDDQGFEDEWTGTGTVVATGSNGTGTAMLTDSDSGGTCTISITGSLAAVTGTPGSCPQTCANGTPNNEMGCDPCMMKACASEYTACQQDTEASEGGGCISCADLLAGNAGSGIDCTNTDSIMQNLVDCACTSTTCD
jgi:hypothetical protein